MAMLFGWGSPRQMRQALPHREVLMLEKFYLDYMAAMYPPVPGADDEHPSEEDIIADAPWDAEVITGGQT